MLIIDIKVLLVIQLPKSAISNEQLGGGGEGNVVNT